MPRYAQFVIGPAGCGKSTYCGTIQTHCASSGRTANVINLDPDAETFDYDCSGDIRELIDLNDLNNVPGVSLGPNGGLVYCLEYLGNNPEWLDAVLGDFEDDYFLFDCPGQIELYYHLDAMQRIIEYLKQKHNFYICTVFILDCHFLIDPKNYISSSLIAVASTLNLACAHVNLMTKIDLLSKTNLHKMRKIAKEQMTDLCLYPQIGRTDKAKKFLLAIAEIVDDAMLSGFMPFNRLDENSITSALYHIDNSIQYGEDLEVKEHDPVEEDN